MSTKASGCQPIPLILDSTPELRTHCLSPGGSIKNYENNEVEESQTESTIIDCHSPACAICLDTLNSNLELLDVPSCGHRFHKKCLIEWKLVKPTCPYCRRGLSDVGPELIKLWGVVIRTEPDEPFVQWPTGKTLLLSPLGLVYSLLLSVVFLVGGLLLMSL